ncbi:ABC transporter permease [Paenisporosarcina cavernae]|uniref:ABC transporter permease n=1 Tax=Paenisporosarcina cavernae TaxID=2320858 RepID=A0A385YRF1_9BACL|nr:ABC transporter permease [Paenisporosarcina cavernae]
MFNLIKNEWMKLWHKKSSWIMVALLVVLLLGVTGIMQFVSGQMDQGSSQPSLQQEKASIEQQLSAKVDPITEKVLKEDLAKIDYQLENDVETIDPQSGEQYLIDSYGLLSIVVLMTVIAAAGIVASEFSTGTIKMLLSRPVKRWKILASKYVTSLLFGLFLALVAMLTTYLASILFYDASNGVLLDVKDGKVVEISVMAKVLKLYGLQFITVIVYATLAFMIGSVFRSSSLAIGLSIFLLFVGPNVVFFLRDYEITKYFFFTHSDLAMYETPFQVVPDITIGFSLAVLFVYMVLFLLVSFWSFVQRDVKA